ncbi:hypothetical protein MKW98_011581 [Papaver atlanticum]|uniref:Aminotransferase-like plant mobile domain-containing protein n=1 Tax=Papaver atlanticum TaxID=357466 RepID=A0AAD4X9F4_9MAGN|nr:hypothetical protein MKW98_011581 [Papaver atlanticum]
MTLNRYSLNSSTQHFRSLKEWPPSPSVMHHCPRMGLECFEALKDHSVNSSYLLANAILNFYDKDGVFKINDEVSIFYGLQDQFFITGLPISGKPVFAPPAENVDELFARLFGDAFPEDTRVEILNDGLITKDNRGPSRKRGVKVSWLVKHFQNKGNKIGDEFWKEHVRAYMLFLIYHYMIPEIEVGVVSHKYLPLLEDVSTIQDYAWGAASYVNTIHELGRIKPATKTFQGLLYPLELFFLGRIPRLLAAVSKWPSNSLDVEGTEPFEISKTFPLMLDWMRLTGTKLNNPGLLSKFLKILSRVKLDDVRWKPYESLTVPINYGKNYQITEARRIPLICFHLMCYHRPDLSDWQFRSVAFSDLGKLIVLKPVSDRKALDKNLLKAPKKNAPSYKVVLDLWNQLPQPEDQPSMPPSEDQPSTPPLEDQPSTSASEDRPLFSEFFGQSGSLLSIGGPVEEQVGQAKDANEGRDVDMEPVNEQVVQSKDANEGRDVDMESVNEQVVQSKDANEGRDVDMEAVNEQVVQAKDANEGRDVNMGPIGQQVAQAGDADQSTGDEIVQVQFPRSPMGEGESYVVPGKELRSSLDWTPELGWTVPIKVDETSEPCVRLIHPKSPGKIKNNNVGTRETSPFKFSPSSVSSYGSASSFPPRLSLDSSDREILIKPSADLLNKQKTGTANMNNGSADKSTLPSSISSIHGDTCESVFARKTRPPRDRYNSCGSSKKMRKTETDSTLSDMLESSIMDLKVLANRVKWLKGALDYGAEFSTTMKPSWKFLRTRASLGD